MNEKEIKENILVEACRKANRYNIWKVEYVEEAIRQAFLEGKKFAKSQQGEQK